jgi:gas vesicle protein
MKGDSIGKVVRAGTWGILLGGAFGFAVGLLLAPEEGKKIRRRLAFHLEQLSRQVGTFIEQVAADDQSSEARREGHELVEDAKQRAQKIRADIDALLGEVQKGRSSQSTASTN